MEPTRERLVIDIGRCTGCHRCLIACAMQHHGHTDPRLARLQVLQFQEPALNVPVICMACDDAPCIKVCPVNARVRQGNQSVVTDEERCIGCGACIYICPVGSPTRNPATRQTMTCDMCQGTVSEPWCVVACRNEGALTLVGSRGTTDHKSRRHADSMLAARQGNLPGENLQTPEVELRKGS